MEKQRNHDMVPIDMDKLQGEVKRAGKTMMEVATEMGFSSNYFARSKMANGIKRATALMLEKLYGIQYEDIKPEEKPDPAEGIKTVDHAPVDYEKLADVIRRAVKDGILDIITHQAECDLVRDMIKNGVKAGMRENIEEMRRAK